MRKQPCAILQDSKGQAPRRAHILPVLVSVSGMGLKIFNTYTRKKEDFQPRKRGLARIYTCGLTVYDYMHIGHARTYIFWDVFRRYLSYSEFQVISVINYTDIEDRIIQRSNERGIDFRDLADEFIEAFDEDCEALNILPYTIHCRATDFVPEMVSMVEKLVEDGYAYVVDGDVYYDVHKFPRYGKLSGHNIEDLEAGARVDVDERKRHPADFALWKAAKPGEPVWDSPWGKGRPGWHIECSAMSTHFLGERIDIHGGAVDNMFPHHENEIAQSEACFHLTDSDERWCGYWMHPEHLMVEDTKMSKSLGNFITVRELLENYGANEVRLLFLGTHYRTQMKFTKDGLDGSKTAYERIKNFMLAGLARVKAISEIEPFEDEELPLTNLAIELEEKFTTAMNDDVNCPAALAAVFEFIKQANNRGWEICENSEDLLGAYEILADILDVLGITIEDSNSGEDTRGRELLDGVMGLVIDLREDARRRKDFAVSDRIRDGLGEIGIILEDTAGGARWKER